MTNPCIRAFIVAAAAFLGTPVSQAQTFTVELARFGGCSGPGCIVEIADNGPLDNSSTTGIIVFDQPIVGGAPNVFSATGTATEIINRDATGRIISIRMHLTDATVEGEAGASTAGQIGLISSEPLHRSAVYRDSPRWMDSIRRVSARASSELQTSIWRRDLAACCWAGSILRPATAASLRCRSKDSTHDRSTCPWQTSCLDFSTSPSAATTDSSCQTAEKCSRKRYRSPPVSCCGEWERFW